MCSPCTEYVRNTLASTENSDADIFGEPFIQSIAENKTVQIPTFQMASKTISDHSFDPHPMACHTDLFTYTSVFKETVTHNSQGPPGPSVWKPPSWLWSLEPHLPFYPVSVSPMYSSPCPFCRIHASFSSSFY